MYQSPLICKDFDNAVRWTENERLDHMFERCCDRLPRDKLAVIAEDAEFTFRDLDNRANQTARYLLELGYRAGDRIGLLFDKSIHGYVALLAVLKIGATYVPLDAGFPAERIGFILEDAAVKGIVSVTRFNSKLSDFGIQRLFLDSAAEPIGKKPTARLDSAERPTANDPLFYIIYTSGTTGKPKGVAIRHSGICNFVKVASEVYGIRESDRCYQGMTLAFDFHVEDLWVPLIAGATLVAGKSGASLFASDLHAFLQNHGITVFPCVPTLLATIEEDLPDVRILLLSGEAVPHNLVVRWHRPGRSILNAYGPTECSVSSTLRRLVPESPVTIGIPLPTYTIVILDENNNDVVPNGAIGEIGIAGIGLAEGYLNREDLTKKKFIADFLNLPNNPSKRIYRTGDLGRIREDGELEFHGRIDTQVKIRGYRVELGEIEALLVQQPHIAQAVVQPYETEPGVQELVGYYTRKSGVPGGLPTEVIETLRKHLPGYMVPAYLEELPAIPMTVNKKTDRQNLPPPRGQRLTGTSGKFVAARTTTERALAEALCKVMKIERASVEDNFFYDLGAHSLLMAQFSAEIRRRLSIASVSMQDIYLNPTVEKLASHIDSAATKNAQTQRQTVESEPIHLPSNWDYFTCGALQLGWYVGWSMVAVWIFVATIRWTYAAMPDLGQVYLRVFGLSLVLAFLSSIVPIAVKWIFIGRWKRQVIPVWSWRYFLFWAAKGFIASAPIAQFGGPIYNLYLRALGAKIGSNVVIDAGIKPVCTDLISIGANTILRKDSGLLGYKAQGNRIYTGPIRIGANAFVGEATVIDIDTVMEDSSQIGNSSSLQSGQRLLKGRRYHGSPAQETTADYCNVEARSCTPLRRYSYTLLLLAISFAFVPIPVLILYTLYPIFYEFIGGAQFLAGNLQDVLPLMAGKLLVLSLAVYFGFFALALIQIGTVPRLLQLFLRENRTYVLYGFHYFIQGLIAGATNSAYFNRVFGDSCGIVHFVRFVGYRLNKIIQTGSNFGEEQFHDNPFLVDIGSGTMISDGLMMSSTRKSNSSFQLGTVKIGENNYLGNYVRYPADGKTGANCLLGTMVLVPVEGSLRENVGLLGSPPFEIPRAVNRDRQMSKMMDAETRRLRLRAKNWYNFTTAILFLAKSWFSFYVLSFAALLALLSYSRLGNSAVYALAIFSFLFSVFWAWLVERASLRFGRLTPQISLVLDRYYWFHERHWHMFGLTGIAAAFSGTPFKNLFSRLEGVRMGKKVFDDGVRWTEYTLIEVGDYANLNLLSTLWPHSLEEGVFKSDTIKIGAGATVHSGSLVHYGVSIGERAVLMPGSYLMKGEVLEPATIWRGNPAKAISDDASLPASEDTSDVHLPVIVAWRAKKTEPQKVSAYASSS